MNDSREQPPVSAEKRQTPSKKAIFEGSGSKYKFDYQQTNFNQEASAEKIRREIESDLVKENTSP